VPFEIPTTSWFLESALNRHKGKIRENMPLKLHTKMPLDYRWNVVFNNTEAEWRSEQTPDQKKGSDKSWSVMKPKSLART